MTNDQVRKLLLDRANEIYQLLVYLRKHQDEKPGISRQNVARYMHDQKLSSRITTLNIINLLLQEGILIDNKTINYQSNLKLNPDYDLYELINEKILNSQYHEILKKLQPFEQFTGKKLKLTHTHLMKN